MSRQTINLNQGPSIGAGTIGHGWARAHPLLGSDEHAGAQGWAPWGVYQMEDKK